MATVKLGCVAREYKETCKGSKEGLPVVGLEHLIPGDITLSSWDDGKDNSFTKVFRKGQILFGRRRAYLKKAVVAPFDGICSGDITVIEAIPGKILPELLPFVVQNDSLFNYAVSKSAGSLSPRVKWEHLQTYEFKLPSTNEQLRLVEILLSINETKEAYKWLLTATDELVKSQFIEMFGDNASVEKGWPRLSLVDICKNPDDIKCGPFGTQLRQSEFQEAGIALWGIPQINSAFSKAATDFLSEEKATALDAYSLLPGDIAMSRKGNVGMCALYPQNFKKGIMHSDALRIRPNFRLINPIFLVQQLHLSPSIRRQIDIVSVGAIMAGVNVTKLKKILIYVPPLELQNRFAAFVETTDKSKFDNNRMCKHLIKLIA